VIRIWAVEEMGRNSVMPSTIPMIIDWVVLIKMGIKKCEEDIFAIV
jgi:hypothetical protein